MTVLWSMMTFLSTTFFICVFTLVTKTVLVLLGSRMVFVASEWAVTVLVECSTTTGPCNVINFVGTGIAGGLTVMVFAGKVIVATGSVMVGPGIVTMTGGTGMSVFEPEESATAYTGKPNMAATAPIDNNLFQFLIYQL